MMPIKKVTPISLDMSWRDMLGFRKIDFSDEERKERWIKWMQLAWENNVDYLNLLTDIHCCIECVHLDKEHAWCNYEMLPVTVNPILTFTHGILGMACKGVSHEQH